MGCFCCYYFHFFCVFCGRYVEEVFLLCRWLFFLLLVVMVNVFGANVVLLIYLILTFRVGVVLCVWHESVFCGFCALSSIVFLCGDNVVKEVCVCWLCDACEKVVYFEG